MYTRRLYAHKTALMLNTLLLPLLNVGNKKFTCQKSQKKKRIMIYESAIIFK